MTVHLIGREVTNCYVSRSCWKAAAPEGDSPVGENQNNFFVVVLEYLETRIARGNLPELTGKAKYFLKTDSELVP